MFLEFLSEGAQVVTLSEIEGTEPPYVIVEIPEKDLDPALIINEGRWVASKKSGWSQRVDAANPDFPSFRHVHVAKTKHTGNKNHQASWNSDGTRHDKKTFNNKVGASRTARAIAKDALGLDDGIILEFVTPEAQKLFEAVDLSVTIPPDTVMLRYKQ